MGALSRKSNQPFRNARSTSRCDAVMGRSDNTEGGETAHPPVGRRPAFLATTVASIQSDRPNIMLPEIDDLTRYAVFLDFDGTLVDIADQPDSVRMNASTLRRIASIQSRVDHALAVVSGREIAVIDQFLRPLKLPVAGVHGLERRDSAGRLHKAATNGAEFAFHAGTIAQALDGERGVIIEVKSGAVALHFRLRPDLEMRCRKIAEDLTRDRPDLALLRGKMVYEIRRTGPNKGTVIREFLDEPPFSGRVPIFAGDDVTDEEGFLVVNDLGGVSIKIGADQTAASYRARDINEFQDWLDNLAFAPGQEP
jgi:trehalose 6-phosphate phosphatase